MLPAEGKTFTKAQRQERELGFYKELKQRQEMRIKHRGVISCVEELKIVRTIEVL